MTETTTTDTTEDELVLTSLADLARDSYDAIGAYLEVLEMDLRAATVDEEEIVEVLDKKAMAEHLSPEEMAGLQDEILWDGTITLFVRFAPDAVVARMIEFLEQYDPNATTDTDGSTWPRTMRVTGDRDFDIFLTRVTERLNRLAVAELDIHGEGLNETLAEDNFDLYRLRVVGDFDPRELEQAARMIITG